MRILALAMTLILAGCVQPHVVEVQPPQMVEHRVHLAEFATDGVTTIEGDDVGASKDVHRTPTPSNADPADYGANERGEYWQDTIIEAKTYTLDAGVVVTTHTHGVVIIASESIIINGRINARSLGADPGESGYASTRAATLALYLGYGETDSMSGEPLLWGAGGSDCNGGGYIILRAPTITINGDLDAGSDCGQAGIVYLEGNTVGAGNVTASLIIHRGQNP